MKYVALMSVLCLAIACAGPTMSAYQAGAAETERLLDKDQDGTVSTVELRDGVVDAVANKNYELLAWILGVSVLGGGGTLGWLSRRKKAAEKE